MSLLVLLDAGKKENVKVTPSTTLAQVVQQVCAKHKLDAQKYTLTKDGKELELSLSFRLSGLTQGQKLSLKKRSSGAEPVLIALQLPSGERVQQEFPSTTSLYEVVQFWETKQAIKLLEVQPTDKDLQEAKGKQGSMQPVVVFMNREISSAANLKSTTLNQLGLSSGSGLLRFFNRYTVDQPVEVKSPSMTTTTATQQTRSQKDDMVVDTPSNPNKAEEKQEDIIPMEDDSEIPPDHNLAVFGPRDTKHDTNEDVPEDFYELTREDLQYLMGSERKRLEESSTLKTQKMRATHQPYKFKKTTIRVRFPDGVQLQGSFYSSSKTEDLASFVKAQLHDPEAQFYLSPPKEELKSNTTLSDQSLVPSAVIHFSRTDGNRSGPFIKEEVMKLIREEPTTEDSEVQSPPTKRATLATDTSMHDDKQEEQEPTEHKQEESTSTTVETDQTATTSTTQSKPAAQAPKWFKMGKR